jgi:transposase
MTDPPLPPNIWDTLSPDAQAAVMALVQSFERRIADLEERLGKNSTNSSRPPSSDPPSVKRRPPAPASGGKRGGQPGHRHHSRALVPPERVRQVIDCKPPACRCCGLDLHGDDPEPLRHQVADMPPIEPTVDEYRLHRLVCPDCGTSTCGTLPPGRSALGCERSSACWPGLIASASDPSANWPPTCWGCRSPSG